jgi:uncharacterized protein YgiM (DUF1202 family)
MVKARQTLEVMVRCMAEHACLVEGDLSDTIDQLYEGGWVNKSTKDNYHTIRILGNKAVHEGDDTAYDANQAYQLLTQEVYAFAHEFTGSRAGRSPSAVRPVQARTSASRQSASAARSTSKTRTAQTGQRTAAKSAYSSSARGRAAAPRKKKRRRVSPLYYIWRILIPILVVILLIVIVRIVFPGKSKKTVPVTTPEVIVTTAPTEPAPTPAPEPETEPETEEEPSDVYCIKGNRVNVRTEPSTDSRVLVQLSNGTEVEYVKRYNNDWAVINYDGQEAYVSSQFLEKIEAAPEEGTQ